MLGFMPLVGDSFTSLTIHDPNWIGGTFARLSRWRDYLGLSEGLLRLTLFRLIEQLP